MVTKSLVSSRSTIEKFSMLGRGSRVFRRIQARRSVGSVDVARRGFLDSWGLGTKKEAKEVASTTKVLSKKIKGIYEDAIDPLNKRLLGPLGSSAHEMLPRPMVFVLGNHSSGKSTFLNHVLGRRVQKTGVAPTDDGFTVITPGKVDEDQDGPSLVGDPDLGFGGLRSFGHTLINHVRLKVRSGVTLRDVMVVDSPGMIDSPMQSDPWEPKESEQYSGVATSARPRDRGYNFPGVVRWFAERADVVLLFFDPDKPGTTGETLGCMKEALSGLEHKTHYILNKADQFERGHDFARAYGSLCWNLSKVIRRKDLPMIYTMCTPTEKNTHHTSSSSSSSLLKEAHDDLALNRQRIIAEVRRAPARQVDNMISRLFDAARLLEMHATMLDAVRNHTRSRLRRIVAPGATAAILLGSGSAFASFSGLLEVGLPAGIAALAATGTTVFLAKREAERQAQWLTDGDSRGLEELFQKQYFLNLAADDDFVVTLWQRAKPQIRRALRTFGVLSLPKVRPSELQKLDEISNQVVPVLRRSASKAAAFLEDEIDKEYGQEQPPKDQ